MEIQQNTGDIVVKKEGTDSTPFMNDGKVLKQEPADQESVETCYNVYDSLIDVVKHELDDNNSEKEPVFQCHIVKQKPCQIEAGLSLDSSTFVTTEPGICVTNNGSKAHSVKSEQHEAIDKQCKQEFEIEIDAVPFNYDTGNQQCINTPSNVCSEPNCDPVIPEPAALDQGESLAVKPTFLLFYYPPISQYELPASGISAQVPCTTYPIVHNDFLNNSDVRGGNAVAVDHSDECKNVSVKHSKSRAKANLMTCNLCPYKSRYRSNLVRHMKIHNEKPCECHLCSYKCASKSGLVYHMRTHTGKKSFVCVQCHRKFKRMGHLVEHMRTHTGEKPFACMLCEKKFSQKSKLGWHMRVTHTDANYKPYVCALCPSQFKHKQHLVEHIRTHTGEKPYCCTHCDYKCKTASGLKSHMKTHSERPYACTVCEHRSAKQISLIRHMRKHC